MGYPPCYQGLAAAWWAYEKAATVTMGYPINIHVYHKVAELIEKGKFVLTPARIHHFQMLTTFPDITIVKCNRANPAEYMSLPHEGEEHECVRETKVFMKLRKDLKADRLNTEEKRTLYVDGSCYRDHRGNHAGYAVVEQKGETFEVIEAKECEQPCSAQLAELEALTRACELANGEAVEIYTDSAYAHGVCHLFGAIWKQRGFMKSGGGPIQHEGQIRALIRAMMGPRELAIIKCQAHKKGADSITQGNTKADKAAKEASGCIEATIAPVEIARPHPGPGAGNIEPQITLEDVAQLQEETSVAEKTMWKDRGALQGQHDKIWRNGEGLVIAPTSLLTILISEAHGVDHCARGEVARKIKKEGFWSPYLQNSIDYILSQCEVCAQNNIRKGITAPIGHIPIPEGPFKHLCMDYVDMGKVVRGEKIHASDY